MEQGVKSKPGRPPRGVASSFSSPSPAVTVEREREAGVRRSSPRVAGAVAGETPPLPLGKPRGRAISKLHDSEPAQKPKMEQSSGRGKRKLSTAPSPLGNVGERQEPREAKEEQGQGKSKLIEPKTPRSSYRTPARRRRPAEPQDEVAVKVAEKEQVSGDIDEDEVEGGDKDSNATEEEAKKEDDKAKDGQGEEEEETDDDGDDEGPKLDEGFYEVEEIQGKRMRKGQCQYLVKWKGWPVSANTWEPTDNLAICSEMIDEFESSRSGKQGRKGKGKRKSSVGLPARKKSRPSSASSLDQHSLDAGFEGQSEGSVSSGDAKQEGSPSKAEAVDGVVLSGTDDEGFAEPNASPKERNGQNTYIKDVAVVDPEPEPEPEPESEPAYSQQALIGEDIKNPVCASMVESNMPNGSCSMGVKATDSESEHVQKPLKESITKEEEATQGLNKVGKMDAVEENEPGKRAGDKCAGAKKRKQGCVRRVPQSIESEEPELKHVSRDENTKELEHVPADSNHANGIDSGSQGVGIKPPSDETKVYDLSALGSPQSAYPLICEIVKAVSYTNTTTNGKQNVSVVFKARRSDGQEVMVDNQFLRVKFPMLLIDFYEQHLRYSA